MLEYLGLLLLYPLVGYPNVLLFVIFIEMYQKIVEATVAYYLMPNTSIHHNLHDIIIKIIADYVIKLTSILSSKLIDFIFDHKISWQEKVAYCGWILSMMIIIKLGIEQLPKDNNIAKNNTVNCCENVA